MLRQPAFIARHRGRDAQREAFLAEQCVAAVTRAVRPNLPRFREVHDVLGLTVARPAAILLAGRERRADRMQARYEAAFFAERVENGAADARHDAHIGDNVWAVGDLHADLGDRAAYGPHRERDHVQGATLHRARKQSAQGGAHFVGVFPVVGRTGVLLPARADERAVLDARDVGRIGARKIRIRPARRIERDEHARRDHLRTEPVVLALATVGPVNSRGLRQVRHLSHPSRECAMAQVGGRVDGVGRIRAHVALQIGLVGAPRRRPLVEGGQLTFAFGRRLGRALRPPGLTGPFFDIRANQTAHDLRRRGVFIGTERFEQRLLAWVDENRQTRGSIFDGQCTGLLNANSMVMLLSSKYNLRVAATALPRDLR